MKRRKDYAKRIMISWVIMFLLGMLLGVGTGILIGKATTKEIINVEESATPTIFF
jgi:hypothetical protein